MKKLLLGVAIAAFGTVAHAEVVGSVDTTFRLLGANDKVVIERFDDPKVENASCYVSYAQTGGVSGSLGLAEDPSRFSIACRATGPIRLLDDVSSEFEEVFSRDTSILFKEMRVSRMLDSDKNVLVYLVWSTKLIDGSPFNSVTAIPIE
jgi:CreA protein